MLLPKVSGEPSVVMQSYLVSGPTISQLTTKICAFWP